MDIQIVAEGLRVPEGPVVMDDGSIIVVEIEAGRITRVKADGSKQTIATPGGGPNGLAIGPDGKLYVCNNGGFQYHYMDGLIIPGHQPDDYSGGRIEVIDLATGPAPSKTGCEIGDAPPESKSFARLIRIF